LSFTVTIYPMKVSKAWKMYELVAMGGTLLGIIISITVITPMIISTTVTAILIHLNRFGRFLHLLGLSVLALEAQILMKGALVVFSHGDEKMTVNFDLVHGDLLKLYRHMINSPSFMLLS